MKSILDIWNADEPTVRSIANIRVVTSLTLTQKRIMAVNILKSENKLSLFDLKIINSDKIHCLGHIALLYKRDYDLLESIKFLKPRFSLKDIDLADKDILFYFYYKYYLNTVNKNISIDFLGELVKCVY